MKAGDQRPLLRRNIGAALGKKHFDLGLMFTELNRRYFRNRLRNYKVEWGRRRKHRPTAAIGPQRVTLSA